MAGDYFIIFLALADFLGSVVTPVIGFLDLHTNTQWLIGEFLCHCLPVVPLITLTASSYLLIAIAVDRYR